MKRSGCGENCVLLKFGVLATVGLKDSTCSLFLRVRTQQCSQRAYEPCIADSFPPAVIIETNKSTERIFPAVPDVESPEFFTRMDKLVKYNEQLVAIGKSEQSDAVKNLMRLPILERMVAEIFQIFIMTPKETGSIDFAENKAAIVY